ncbi:MAG: transposase [Gammaproteobacteria bacterium]|nr:transposase [Gammaproteobacteria bacterium]
MILGINRRIGFVSPFSQFPGEEPRNERVAKANGFSLHAGVSCEAHQRTVREGAAYIARPAVAEQRLTVNAQGKVVYLLKTLRRDDARRFRTSGFHRRPAAIGAAPSRQLDLATTACWTEPPLGAEMTPGRGRRKGKGPRSPSARHRAARGDEWAQRLQPYVARVLCGQAVKIIARIEEPALIERILEHVRGRHLEDTGAHRRQRRSVSERRTRSARTERTRRSGIGRAVLCSSTVKTDRRAFRNSGSPAFAYGAVEDPDTWAGHTHAAGRQPYRRR